jgi:ABC-2 type transport system permease protein
VAGVRLYTSQWLQLAGVLLVGTIPFCLMGLTLGLTLSAKSAPATINLIYLPLAFLGGLWLPIQMLPGALQQLAFMLPSYHLGQLGYAVIGQDRAEPMWVNLAVLAVYSAVFALLAKARFHAQSQTRL